MGKLFKALLCLLVISACVVAPISADNFGCDADYYQAGYLIGYSDGYAGLLYNPPELSPDHNAWYNNGLRHGYRQGYNIGVILSVPAEEQRYHPESNTGYHDSFIYQAEIGNVTFHFTIAHGYLDDSNHDLYIWLTPVIKERQDNREQNTIFKFEADTKDLVVYNPDILEDDTLHQNYMMLNLEGYNTECRDCRPSYNQWLDKEHDTYKHRQTLGIGQEHTIVVWSCWDWFCTRPDGSIFEEHSRDLTPNCNCCCPVIAAEQDTHSASVKSDQDKLKEKIKNACEKIKEGNYTMDIKVNTDSTVHHIVENLSYNNLSGKFESTREVDEYIPMRETVGIFGWLYSLFGL